MSTTVSYKGSTLTTVNNATKKLNTSGKYLEDDITLVDVTQGGTTINNQDKSVTPTESAQSVTYDSGYTGLGTVSVGAISSLYVGSEVARKTSSDLVASNNTIVAPAGYYENAASKTVQAGTAGTPTATKGSVVGHAVTVTPSVTNSAGWISSETKTGTGVTVTAQELASGTATYTENDTYDVVGLSTVTVNVASSGGSTWTVAEATHNTSYTGAVFNAPTGCTSLPGAYILYKKSALSSLNQYGKCIAIIHDSSDDLMWTASSTGVEKSEVSGVNDYYENGKIVLDDDNTYGLAENGATYGLICIFGGTGSISFRRASATPSSDSTTISFTTNEEPAVYFAGMNGTGTLGSTHYAYTVAANGNSINATNFYTGNIGYYSNFTDAFSGSALTITSPGSSTGGYFKSGATYNAYYLTTSDLGGSAYLGTKTITVNGTYDASTDGYDGYSEVTVNVSGGGTITGLLQHERITLVSTATGGNGALDINLIPTDKCMISVSLADIPSSPDSSEYIALSAMQAQYSTYGFGKYGYILRPAGTVGTDQWLNFNATTGVLKLGGSYGHLLAGTTYDIYQISMGA